MKKFVSLLVAMIVALGTTVTAEVYIPQDIRGTEFEKDVELLINLGIIEYTEYGMLKPNSHMTRADYAVLVSSVLRDKGVSDRNVFSDVEGENPARDSINKLYEYGYISGDGNSLFRPDDDIRYSEALKIMVSILGYDILAKQKGGYPQGYTSVAANIGITKGVIPDGEYISRGNAMRLLVNSFETNPMEIDFVGGDSAFKVATDKTMLSEMLGIYFVEECVNANSNYAISGQIARAGRLYIGKEEMIASPEYDEYVGYQVECWYRKNDNDEYEALYIRKLESRYETVKVDAKNINNVNNYLCRYSDEKGRELNVKFSGVSVFIYNGKKCTSFDNSLLDFKNGWVEFIDYNNDRIADVVKINNYYDIVVESVTDEKIYSKYSPEKSINIEETDLKIFDDDENEITLSDIKKDDVLTVFLSNDTDNNVAKIIRSRKTVNGAVTAKKDEDGATYVTIDYKDYVVYDGYKTLFTSSISIGENAEYLLDAYGVIVSTKVSGVSDYMPGLLINAKKKKNRELAEEVLELKMSTQSGVILLNAADKVRVDTIRYRTSEFEDLAKTLQSKIGEIILYKLNSKGNIISIDTTDQNVTASNDDRLVTGPSIAASENLRYQSSTRVIEGRFPLDENAKMFVVPANIANAEDSQFKVTGASEIANASYISGATTYKINSNKMTVDYIVMQGSTKTVKHDSDIAIVKKITTVLNRDDEAVPQLTLDVFGKERNLLLQDADVLSSLKYLTKYSRNGDTLVDFAAASMPTLKRGDIVKYSLDADGNIDAIIMVYSADTKTMHSRNPYHDDFHEQGYRYVQGTVTEKYDEYVILNTRNECHRIGNVDIYEVDTSQKEILKRISMSEIGVGDTIIVLMGSGKQIMTLLYR